MSERLVNAENLSRRYGDKLAVDNVSLQVNQGDILGFLGPNGAGKSTTMQMLCGVLAASSGQIEINGVDLFSQPREAKKHIGYLPEQPPLYLDLNVDEYLRYAARLRGIPAKQLADAVSHAKQRTGLQESSRRLIGNLSKGYQQRVGIAQAIIHNPAVVILDEPTVGLDPIQIREIRQLILELGQQHAVILSTHILAEVQTLCNRIEIINEGRMVFSDSLANLDDAHQASLLVSFDRPPPITQLEALAGVQQAEQLSDKQFRLLLEDSQPMGELIVSASVAQDWGLQELTPERHSLEQIFVQLISSSEQAA